VPDGEHGAHRGNSGKHDETYGDWNGDAVLLADAGALGYLPARSASRARGRVPGQWTALADHKTDPERVGEAARRQPSESTRVARVQSAAEVRVRRALDRHERVRTYSIAYGAVFVRDRPGVEGYLPTRISLAAPPARNWMLSQGLVMRALIACAEGPLYEESRSSRP
jgi:hypothetical protein